MAELKVGIPEELKQDFKKVSDADVSMAVTRLLKAELERLSRLKKIVSRSRLREKDVKELSAKVDASLRKRFNES